jgi:hypothetical protein
MDDCFAYAWVNKATPWFKEDDFGETDILTAGQHLLLVASAKLPRLVDGSAAALRNCGGSIPGRECWLSRKRRQR